MSPEIVPFRPDLAPHFGSLNLEWIEKWFTVEPKDRAYFDNPEGTIVAPGGQIFFLLEGGVPVGTVAAIRVDAESFELAKMAVCPACQGRGYGKELATAAIEYARAAGAKRLVLLSDSRLISALRLYEKLGFVHLPSPAVTGYARGDVSMVLELGSAN